jgi:uncharacterized protein (TIGR03067 family)
MNSMRTWFAAILIVACPALADDADKDLTGDLKGLQGSWTAMVGPNKDVALVLTFKGKDLSFHVTTPDGQEFDMKAKVKLDEKATPKKLDFVEMTGPDDNAIGDALAIYELKDGELKVCGGGPGKDRPTEFKDDPDNMVQISIFKKKKA